VLKQLGDDDAALAYLLQDGRLLGGVFCQVESAGVDLEVEVVEVFEVYCYDL
jgi:hypothetical protein